MTDQEFDNLIKSLDRINEEQKKAIKRAQNLIYFILICFFTTGFVFGLIFYKLLFWR